MKNIVKNVDLGKFTAAFQKNISYANDYMFNTKETFSSTCGYIYKTRFQIWENIGIRNLKMIFHEVLIGEWYSDGTIKYRFQKRRDGVILLLAMAVMCCIMGVFSYRDMANFWALIPFALIAILNIGLIFSHSKRNRRDLIAALNRVIYEASAK